VFGTYLYQVMTFSQTQLPLLITLYSLKCDKINGHFTRRSCLGMRNVRDKYWKENRNIRNILYSLFFLIHAFYEIWRENIVHLGRQQMTIWRTHPAGWIPEITNTH